MKLSLPGARELLWHAEGPGPAEALAFLAQVCRLPLQESPAGAELPAGALRILQWHRGDPAEGFLRHGWSHTFWKMRDDGGCDVLIGNIDCYTPVRRGSLARWLFFLGILPALRQGPHWLVHGALFRDADGRNAALFGPSGIGKSTTAASLEREGFTVFCDDAFILTEKEGRFWANVSPTWSIYTNHKPYREFECAAVHELQKLYVADRGEHRREVVPPWCAGMLATAALSTLTEFHLREAMRPEITRELEKKAFDAAGRLTHAMPLVRLRLKLGEAVAPLLAGHC